MKYQIDQSGNRTKKSAFADLVRLTDLRKDWSDNLENSLLLVIRIVNSAYWVWTRRELNPVDLGYQTSLASLPSPHHNYCNKFMKTEDVKESIRNKKDRWTLKRVSYNSGRRSNSVYKRILPAKKHKVKKKIIYENQ